MNLLNPTTDPRIQEYERWLKRRNIVPTTETLRCIELVDRWLGGLHHAPRTVRQWGDGIELLMGKRDLSTFDGDSLTHLVFLAHDLCVRAEVGTQGMSLSVILHARERIGNLYARHPMLEQAVAKYRATNSREVG